MLASDPHLETTRLPQFWYYAGLHTEADNIDVLGITVPGLPFFIMGHNFEAAWAFTAGGIDITEYYTEKINPENKNQYLTADGWKNFTIINDTIIIRNNESEILEIKITENGPIIMDGADSNRVISIHWAGFDTDLNQTITNGFKLAAVSDFEIFRHIVTNLGALNANWVFADTGGNIGYQLGTPVPVRPGDTKNFPLEGWLPQNKWMGYYPLEQTPYTYNPARGWLATCNNKPAVDLPYNLPGNFFHNRILRISSLLESKDIFSIEDMVQYQLDIIDTSLLRWKNEVTGLLDSIGENNFADTLRDWDGSTGVDSRETLLLNLFLNQLKKHTFKDELGDLSSGISTTWLEEIYNSNDTAWFDNTTTPEKIESRTETAKEALREALSLAGKNTWGEAHSLTMRHPLARIPVLSGLLGLSHGPWPWQGSGGTLNASYFRMDTDSTFSSIVGPSWRLSGW